MHERKHVLLCETLIFIFLVHVLFYIDSNNFGRSLIGMMVYRFFIVKFILRGIIIFKNFIKINKHLFFNLNILCA